VRLLLFDRVGTGSPPPPLHRDIRALRYELHFDAMRPVHVSERRIVADLRYEARWVTTVIETEGAAMSLGCELADLATAKWLSRLREQRAQRLALVQRLRQAMLAQIDEALPFDEPVTEYGQQDGYLRLKWEQAYLAGRSRFRFQGDVYHVYDERGRPRVPQVCADFLTDTFERTSGTWWQRRGETPGRVQGRLELDRLSHRLRQVEGFIGWAEAHPEWFDVEMIPPAKRVPFRRGRAFYEHLRDSGTFYQPGDVVIIRGYTPFDKPWMKRAMHYHSFFVYESDPVTGMPITIAGNAATPALRAWETEALRTPKRSIWYRIRPRNAWLRQITGIESSATTRSKGGAPQPPPLAVGPAT
jgi:hypothetical protein